VSEFKPDEESESLRTEFHPDGKAIPGQFSHRESESSRSVVTFKSVTTPSTARFAFKARTEGARFAERPDSGGGPGGPGTARRDRSAGGGPLHGEAMDPGSGTAEVDPPRFDRAGPLAGAALGSGARAAFRKRGERRSRRGAAAEPGAAAGAFSWHRAGPGGLAPGAPGSPAGIEAFGRRISRRSGECGQNRGSRVERGRPSRAGRAAFGHRRSRTGRTASRTASLGELALRPPSGRGRHRGLELPPGRPPPGGSSLPGRFGNRRDGRRGTRRVWAILRSSPLSWPCWSGKTNLSGWQPRGLWEGWERWPRWSRFSPAPAAFSIRT
jgi:hypothetical protein